MLVKCPECKKEVSSDAKSCPNCGYSISAVTIEKTSKSIKFLYVVFFLMLVVSVPFCVASKSSTGSTFGVVIFVISLLGFLVTSISEWWHHG